MSEFDGYSLTGCRIDRDYQGPELESLAGSDPMTATGGGIGQLPVRVDLRKWCSPVEDQQRTGSCVANAVVGALELLQRKEAHSDHDLSRLFVYYNARRLEGEAEITDNGTFVNMAMAAIIAHGICEERMWPFSELTVNDPPTQACYENASNYRAVEFAQIRSGSPVTHILAQGIPVVISLVLPRDCYIIGNATGLMQLPPPGSIASQDCGHAMLVVGYDLEQQVYIVRNSWGERWAAGGYCLLPFALFAIGNALAQSWAIGSLGSAPGLRLLGRSVPDAVAGMVQAAQAAQAPRTPAQQDPGKGLRDDLQGDIDKARRGFASRLRGGQ